MTRLDLFHVRVPLPKACPARAYGTYGNYREVAFRAGSNILRCTLVQIRIWAFEAKKAEHLIA
jgi:hypothetical protein